MTQFIPFGNRFHLREIVRATFGDKSVDRSQPLANADPHVSSHSVEILLLDRIYTTEKSLIANLFFIKNMFIHFYMYRIGNAIIIVICGILFHGYSMNSFTNPFQRDGSLKYMYFITFRIICFLIGQWFSIHFHGCYN